MFSNGKNNTIKKNELAAVVVVVAAFLVLAVPATITTPAPAAQAQLPPLSPEEKQEGVDAIMNGTISSQIRLNQTAQTLIAQDPQFKAFTEIWVNCLNHLGYLNGTISEEQCNATFDEGTGKWCGLEQYDMQKCDYASNLVRIYENIRTTFQMLEMGIFEPI